MLGQLPPKTTVSLCISLVNMTTDYHFRRTTIFGTFVFHNTKNFSSYPKAKKFTYLGCTCSKHPLGYLYSENKCSEFPNTLLFHPWKWETSMGDLFKDLIESGSKKTVENFIYQNLAGTATMHNEIIGVF